MKSYISSFLLAFLMIFSVSCKSRVVAGAGAAGIGEIEFNNEKYDIRVVSSVDNLSINDDGNLLFSPVLISKSLIGSSQALEDRIFFSMNKSSYSIWGVSRSLKDDSNKAIIIDTQRESLKLFEIPKELSRRLQMCLFESDAKSDDERIRCKHEIGREILKIVLVK